MPAKSGEGQGPGSSGSLAGAEFVIGDFDGDRIPDMATVEANPNSARGNSRYSIRLQLTSGAAQVFGVTAPAGGLQIVARDVNGDNALDLLVSTAWQHKEVAVLLNDGHGNFKLAEPGAFPVATREDEEQWNLGTIAFCESGVLIRSENATGAFKDDYEGEGIPREVGLVFLGGRLPTGCFSLSSILSRAPPQFVHHS